MQNLLKYVAEIEKQYTRAMPDGLDEQFLKKLPVLFDRIRELERALLPFAEKFAREHQVCVKSSTQPPELVQVYFNDCKKAAGVLDPENAATEVKPQYRLAGQ